MYVGNNGEFLGYYASQGKYYTKTPGNLVDPTGAPVPASNNPCWAYKPEGSKQWVYGLPPEGDRMDVSSLFLNFTKESNIGGNAGSFGPYENGMARFVYREAP